MEARKENDKMFILSAVTLELFGVAKKVEDYLDQYGMQHFYDMCIDIVEEMLSEEDYNNYLSDKDYFYTNHNTCFDWYYMVKSRHMFTDERIRRVAGLI
jgi:ABC-type oligopeptide transport system substrate-binding subunit